MDTMPESQVSCFKTRELFFCSLANGNGVDGCVRVTFLAVCVAKFACACVGDCMRVVCVMWVCIYHVIVWVSENDGLIN